MQNFVQTPYGNIFKRCVVQRTSWSTCTVRNLSRFDDIAITFDDFLISCRNPLKVLSHLLGLSTGEHEVLLASGTDSRWSMSAGNVSWHCCQSRIRIRLLMCNMWCYSVPHMFTREERNDVYQVGKSSGWYASCNWFTIIVIARVR